LGVLDRTIKTIPDQLQPLSLYEANQSMGSDGVSNFIGGVWRNDPAGEIKPVCSPIDGSTIGTMSWSPRQAAIEAIAAARRAQQAWRKVSTWDRASAMRRIGDAIAARRDELAALLTLEQGKPGAEPCFEVGKSVDLVKYLEGQTIPTEDPNKRVMTFCQPRGVYAVVTPWNW
jgi:acyl-CoA reductase-like NAD-dependent aldehyde dehydrogenase